MPLIFLLRVSSYFSIIMRLWWCTYLKRTEKEKWQAQINNKLMAETVYDPGNVRYKATAHIQDMFFIQFSSVAQSCPTLCDHMNRSMPDLLVHHQLLEITQTHVHWDGDDIQPSHPATFPSSPALNLSQHQGLFQWVNASHLVAKVLVSVSTSVLPMYTQDWFIRLDWMELPAVQGTLKSLFQYYN